MKGGMLMGSRVYRCKQLLMTACISIKLRDVLGKREVSDGWSTWVQLGQMLASQALFTTRRGAGLSE